MMHFFITGTGTNVGKTMVCSWLALHTNYEYFKPIQTGSIDSSDSALVAKLAHAKIHKESYVYTAALSPHAAAALEDQEINIENIVLPNAKNLIIEGAGGLLVPINRKHLMIDLVQSLNVPVILVADSRLGAINHALLSLEALRSRGIEILGVIMNNMSPEFDEPEMMTINSKAIAFYGKTRILAQLPFLHTISSKALSAIPLSPELSTILGV